MKVEYTKSHFDDPFSEYGKFSYEDYLTWQIDGMVELIKGKVFRTAAAPKRRHQEILLKIASKLYYLLDNQTCKAFIAPFDVRLPVHSKKKRRHLHRCTAGYLCGV
jgi:hypothetical protein